MDCHHPCRLHNPQPLRAAVMVPRDREPAFQCREGGVPLTAAESRRGRQNALRGRARQRPGRRRRPNPSRRNAAPRSDELAALDGQSEPRDRGGGARVSDIE
jgi:hypothetical protein